MIHSRVTTGCIVLSMAIALLQPFQAARADNGTIPDYLTAAYHRALELRQYYQEDLSMSERNVRDIDSYLNQINKILPSLSSDAPNRAPMLALRVRLRNLEDKYQRELDEDEGDLARVESDLARIESDMKHYACLK